MMPHSVQPKAVIAARAAMLLVGLLVLAAGAWPTPAAAGGGEHQAALVVRFADGDVQTRCVTFDEPAISGEQLLARSGLAVTMDYNAGLGGAVCSINSQGCSYPKQSCFCNCTGATCEYWGYYLRTSEGWKYSQQGASSVMAGDGAVQGWSWGPGNFASGTEPPEITFAEVCGARPAPAARAAGLLSPDQHAFRSPAEPLLAQYGPFLFMAVLLLGAGAWVVVRRRSKATLAPERSQRS